MLKQVSFATLLLSSSLTWAEDNAKDMQLCRGLLTEQKMIAGNLNAVVPTREYNQANLRSFGAYSNTLGLEFGEFFWFPAEPVKWLDVGAGFGLASIGKAVEAENVSATIINTQDSWEFVFNSGFQAAQRHRYVLARIGLAMQIDTDLVFGATGRHYRARLQDKLVTEIQKIFNDLILKQKITYHVGFAENILPDLSGGYNVISDVFGAYFYSVNRLALLDHYYNLLGPGGKAFVTTQIEERYQRQNPPVTERYGPVSLFEGGDHITLEEELVKMYPTVFEITFNSEKAGGAKVLKIKKDPGISSLQLRDQFEITRFYYDESAPVLLMREIPIITIRRRN